MKALNRWRWLAVTLVSCWAPAAVAQTDYPSEPVHLVAPFSPGGAADTVARIISAPLSESLGQPVVVENKAGAGGSIGSASVASAEPDGLTLLLNLGPPHQTVHLFNEAVKYDPVNDFTAIAMVAKAPQVLAVPASSPYDTAAEFIEAAREQELTFGSSGIGTSQHLGGLLLNEAEGTQLIHIAYRGGSEALAALLGEQTDAGIVVLSNVVPYIKSGQLKALAVLEDSRAANAPDIPTIGEALGNDFSVPETWVGVLGPAGLSDDITARLHDDINAALEQEETIKLLENAGYEPRSATSEEFSEQLKSSEEMYRRLVSKTSK